MLHPQEIDVHPEHWHTTTNRMPWRDQSPTPVVRGDLAQLEVAGVLIEVDIGS